MSGIRFFVDRWYASGILIVLAIFLSYDLASVLRRAAEPPANMVELAGRQAGAGFIVSVVGAGLGAMLTARHHRRAGQDYWVSATRSQSRLCALRFSAIALPVTAAWTAYLLLTSMRLGIGGYHLYAIAVLAMSFTGVAVGCALGQLVGIVVPWILAVPTALVVSYVGFGVLSAMGDDYWWGWLVPVLGDSLHPPVHTLWLLGETAWFSGVTLAFLVLAAWLGSRPRVLPLRPTIAAALLLLAGGIMLYLNGEDASGDMAALSKVTASHQATSS